MESSNYHIKQISSQETFKVRHLVLRTGKPIETCVFAGDNLETTIHLGIYSKDDIVGICSFFKNPYDALPDKKQYQLRGMAVLISHQKKGLGKKLLRFGENLLQQKSTSIIWCNAREVAVNFYKINGYNMISKPFDIAGVGKHFVMSKLI